MQYSTLKQWRSTDTLKRKFKHQSLLYIWRMMILSQFWEVMMIYPDASSKTVLVLISQSIQHSSRARSRPAGKRWLNELSSHLSSQYYSCSVNKYDFSSLNHFLSFTEWIWDFFFKDSWSRIFSRKPYEAESVVSFWGLISTNSSLLLISTAKLWHYADNH